MKSIFITLTALILFFTQSYSQEKSSWNNWSGLIGEWKGEGNGQPGQGGGTFSFQVDLGGKILVRKAHTDFPASGDRPAFSHDDLLIASLDYSGNPSKAIYFDNEGHTINYTISYPENTVVLLSEKIPNVPIFKLTYKLIDAKIVNTKFEMSQDGEKFMTYIEGKSIKVK